MSAWMSSAKASSLLTSLQLNPEIRSDDELFVTEVIQRASRWLTSEVGLKRYPHLSQGYSLSNTGASTDISSESTNSILISVDGSAFKEITLTLAGLTSGSAIASELQAQIRGVAAGGFKFATVTYTDDGSDDTFEVGSAVYGNVSAVNVSYKTDYEDIAVALKLGAEWGGEEFTGSAAMDGMDDMVLVLVAHWYNMIGVEGMRSFSTPGDGSYTSWDIPPEVSRFISSNRRIF